MNTMFLLLQAATPVVPQKQNSMTMWIMLGLLVVVFYFFMIRPQQKQQKLVKQFRENLKVGDKVLTTSGIYGKIFQINKESNFIVLEVDTNVKMKFDINAVVQDPHAKAEETK